MQPPGFSRGLNSGERAGEISSRGLLHLAAGVERRQEDLRDASVPEPVSGVVKMEGRRSAMRAKLTTLAMLPLLAGCGYAFGAHAHGGPYYEDRYYDYDDRPTVRMDRLRVPRGYLPAPGRCRIWLPGVAPGHQSPEGSCRRLERRVPRGGWLLARPYDHYEVVEVFVYDHRNPRTKYRYVFDARTGQRYRGAYRGY
jgi:hypothetical protein